MCVRSTVVFATRVLPVRSVVSKSHALSYVVNAWDTSISAFLCHTSGSSVGAFTYALILGILQQVNRKGGVLCRIHRDESNEDEQARYPQESRYLNLKQSTRELTSEMLVTNSRTAWMRSKRELKVLLEGRFSMRCTTTSTQ
jgi:hypothetical protein